MGVPPSGVCFVPMREVRRRLRRSSRGFVVEDLRTEGEDEFAVTLLFEESSVGFF
jgi:hypothetical protein